MSVDSYGKNMAYKPTKEDFEIIERQSGTYQPSLEDFLSVEKTVRKPPSDWADKYYNFAETFAGRPGRSAFIGAAQTLADVLPSIANIVLGKTPLRLPYADLSGFREESSGIAGIPEKIGYGLGRIGGLALPIPGTQAGAVGGGAPQAATSLIEGVGGAASGGLSSLKQALGMAPELGIPGMAAAGGATGFALGGSEEDSRLLPTALGAAGGAATGAIQKYAPSPSKLMNKILNRGKEAEKEGSALYQDIFDRPIGNTKVGDLRMQPIKEKYPDLMRYLPRKFKSTVQRFIDNPTLNNAQKAQSDLGKYVNKLPAPGQRTAQDNLIHSEAKRFQSLLRKKIGGQLNQVMGDEGAQAYQMATQNWKDNVVPFSSNKTLSNYKKLLNEQASNRLKKEFADSTLKKLRKDNNLMQQVGDEFPELKNYNNYSKLIKHLEKKVLPGAVGASLLKKKTYIGGEE